MMQVNNEDEAFNFVDTQIRQHWLEVSKKDEFISSLELGKAVILQEEDFNGHKVWQFNIEGLPMSRDGRRRWIVDTGEIIETTLDEEENTLDKAYAKLQRVQTSREKAAELLGIDAENLAVAKADEIGMRCYEPIMGGRSVIIGNDGGLLFANSTVNPEDHIQAYKDGKRTLEENFASSNTTISEEQVRKFVQDEYGEADSSDRIEDRGFAYYISTQPREYLDTKDDTKMTIGNGPIVILKETGDIYSFSSNPLHMFGSNGVGVNTAKTLDEFSVALNELKDKGDGSATSVERIS